MKRSQMVEFMAEVMEKHFDGNNGSWYEDAEKVLDMMEEKGISPPEWDNYNPDQVSRTFSSDKEWGRGKDGPNGEYRSYLKQKTWEPEND